MAAAARAPRTSRRPWRERAVARACPSKLYFRIGEVAELVGVEPHVLRYWEREFRTIRPDEEREGAARLLAPRRREPDARSRAPLPRGLHDRRREEEAPAHRRRRDPAPPKPDVDGAARGTRRAAACAAQARLEAFRDRAGVERPLSPRDGSERARRSSGARQVSLTLEPRSDTTRAQPMPRRRRSQCYLFSGARRLVAPGVACRVRAGTRSRRSTPGAHAASARRTGQRTGGRRRSPPTPCHAGGVVRCTARRRPLRDTGAAVARPPQPAARPARPRRARGSAARTRGEIAATPQRGLQRRLVGHARARSSSSTATSAPGRSSFTTSPSAATAASFAGQRPAVPGADPARPDLHERDERGREHLTRLRRRAAQRAQPTALQRQDRVGRQRAPAARPGDRHLRQPAHRDARSRARQPGPRLDARRLRHAARPRDDDDRRDERRRPRVPVGGRTTATRRSASSRRTQGPPTAGRQLARRTRSTSSASGPSTCTPVGQLRFGRMPGHWGLGMVENSGDGIDSDYQTTLDRIMFVTRHQVDGPVLRRRLGLPLDRADERERLRRLRRPAVQRLQPLQRQRVGGVRRAPDRTRRSSGSSSRAATSSSTGASTRSFARNTSTSSGDDVACTDAAVVDVDQRSNGTTASSRARPGRSRPDLWVQTLWRKLRFEAEAATIHGADRLRSDHAARTVPTLGRTSASTAVATQTEFRAVEDKLDLQFGFGWASGDPYAYNASATGARQGRADTGPQSELATSSTTSRGPSRRSASTPTTASTSSSFATS